MSQVILQRAENLKNKALSKLHEVERKIRELELQRERHRGEVSAAEDAIDFIKQENAKPL